MTPPPEPLVPVFRTADSTLLPLLKTVLDAAGIPYVVQGDASMGLLPLGPLSTGLLKRVLGATILVPAEFEDEARDLLEQRVEPASDEADLDPD